MHPMVYYRGYECIGFVLWPFHLTICQDSDPQGEESVKDKDILVGGISNTALTQPKSINVKVRLETPVHPLR